LLFTWLLSNHRLIVGGEDLPSSSSCEAKETVKALAFSAPLWEAGAGEDFIIKKTLNINMLPFYKIPLYPPFPKREAKNRILSQSLTLHFQVKTAS